MKPDVVISIIDSGIISNAASNFLKRANQISVVNGIPMVSIGEESNCSIPNRNGNVLPALKQLVQRKHWTSILILGPEHCTKKLKQYLEILNLFVETSI